MDAMEEIFNTGKYFMLIYFKFSKIDEVMQLYLLCFYLQRMQHWNLVKCWNLWQERMLFHLLDYPWRFLCSLYIDVELIVNADLASASTWALQLRLPVHIQDSSIMIDMLSKAIVEGADLDQV